MNHVIHHLSSAVSINSHPNKHPLQLAFISISNKLKHLSKLLSQKKHYQSCSLKKCIIKIAPSKKEIILLFSFNLLFIRIITRNFQAISKITNHFFSFLMYLRSFKNILADNSYCYASTIMVCFKNFFIMKVCRLITV